MASRTRTVVAAFSFTGSAIGVAAYLLWRRSAAHNLLPAEAVNAAGGNDGNEEPDPCAICLEPPTEAVRTQCNHRFCLGCFRSWAHRQSPPTSHVRCPLCTTAVLRLVPEFTPANASADTLRRLRWLLSYNLEALLTVRLAWITRAFGYVRSAAAATAVTLYVFTGHAWETVQLEMRRSFAPVPTATDCKLRASSRWLVSAHLLSVVQRFIAPPDVRHEQMVELLETLRPIALFSVAFTRDSRHARILLAEAATPDGATLTGQPVLPRPPPAPAPAPSPVVAAAGAVATAAAQLAPGAPGVPTVAAAAAVDTTAAATGPASFIFASAMQLRHATALCRAAHLVGAVLRLARATLLWAHTQRPDAVHAHPLVMRALDAAIALSELVAVGMHIRVELAGLHGLLTLFSWAESCGTRVFTEVRPHESGLWLRRYCEVREEVLSIGRRGDETRHVHRRGVRWEEALRELYVPLRALLAFYGDKGLRQRDFPRWAVEDIRRGCCALSAENVYEAAAAAAAAKAAAAASNAPS